MYTVPFVDYPAHYRNLRPELEPLIDEVIFERSDFIMRGDLVEFEKNMTSFLGVKDSVGLKSLALGGLGIPMTPITELIGTGRSQITMANNTTLAGHVHLGDWVTVGGLTGIHQFVSVGAHAMVGFASAVTQDVPPFMLVDGNPLAVRGFNQVGLRRRGFSAARIAGIKQMHKLLYRQGLTLDAARAGIDALATEAPECADDVAVMARFLAAATRGIGR